MCVVFLENSRTTFNPSWIRSNFIHVYVVVQHVVGAHGQPLYRVAVVKRSTVPTFSPELKHVGVFAHSKTLQQFLLTKIVNGERASYHAPKFLKLTVSPVYICTEYVQVYVHVCTIINIFLLSAVQVSHCKISILRVLILQLETP